MAKQADGSERFYDEYRGWKVTALFNEGILSVWNTYIECSFSPQHNPKLGAILSQTIILEGGLKAVWRKAQLTAHKMIDFYINNQSLQGDSSDQIPPDLYESPF
jgi:hypothetical protein